MKDKVFIDTNILIYIYSTDQQEKKSISQKIVGQNSTQVIQEFANTLRKKNKAEWNDIAVAIDEVTASTKVFVNKEKTIKRAIDVAEKYRYSFYDSLIIASALENNCHILYSEDMQHKQVINGKVQIINPFVKK